MKRLTLLLTCFFISMGLAIAQNTNVNGTIVDDTGESVIGASIMVKGSPTIGTVSDINGKFQLTVPSPSAVLVITYLGMETQEVAAGANLNVTLVTSTEYLDEVVVVAYGTVKKSAYTGSGSEVKGKALENVPVSSFEQALQGAAPGVTVSTSTGQPGANQNIYIRGLGSMNAGNTPLYVVDGVPLTSGNISSSGVTGQTGSLGLSNLINNNDIESVTVLKDAAAAAMYGSRGANGVILITTKRGKTGKVKVNFNSSWGVNDFAINNRPIIGGDDLRTLWTESIFNYYKDNYGSAYSDAEYLEFAQGDVDEMTPKSPNGYSDWEKALFNDYGSIQKYELTLNGGSDKTKYFASLGYRDEEGKVSYSWLKQYTGRINLLHEEDKFKFGVNASLSKMENSFSPEGTAYANPYYGSRNFLFPTTPIYNEDGKTFYTGALLNGMPNLVKDAGLDSYGNEVFNTNSTIWGEYEFVKGLKFKQTLNYEYIQNNVTTNWPLSSNNGASQGGLTIKINPRYEKLYSGSFLTYDKLTADNHYFDVLAGWEANKRTSNTLQAVGSGFATDDIIELAGSSTSLTTWSNKTDDRLLSFISRFNYNYDERYFLSASFRRDGSSRFGKNTRWGDFWSLSGAWRISREEFLNDVDFLDELKLRASYGISGTLPNEYYSHLATYDMYGAYNGKPVSYPSLIANPDLSWEKNNTFDIGLEVVLFNRLNLEFDYYSKQTKDLLLSVPVSQTTGFSTTLRNEGEMSNTGIEIDIAYDILKDGEFKWTSGIAAAYNKNEIKKLSGGQDIISTPHIHREGEAYYSFYAREYAGVNSETGAEQWYTNKELADGTIERNLTEDPTEANRVVIGKISPDWTGGWRNSFSWKGLELNVLFTFSAGSMIYDSGWPAISNGLYDFNSLPDVSQLDRWQKPGDKTDVGRRVYGYSYGNYTSSKWFSDNDYIRLKNVSLSYSLPSKFIKRLGVNNLKVYASGTNLLTFSSLSGLDPEGGSTTGIIGYELPPLKSAIFGIEIGF